MQPFIGLLRDVLHFPMPVPLAYLAILIETLGGLAFLAGVALTPVGKPPA